jgi:hypothetical protein
MSESETSRINKIWKKEGKKKNLIPPKIPLAFDKNGEQYFVYEDHSTILRIYLNKSNIAFVIPKNYTSVVTVNGEQKYLIKDIFELHPISCPKKNEYQRFVMEFLVA